MEASAAVCDKSRLVDVTDIKREYVIDSWNLQDGIFTVNKLTNFHLN